MQSSAALPALIVLLLVVASSAQAQEWIANPQEISAAKTIYFDDRSGMDAAGAKALAELSKWGRFQIVQDKENANLVLLLEKDARQGGELVFSGGQTGTIDSQGHIAEDAVPNYNKQTPVSYAFLTVIDGKTGAIVWRDSQRWGGLLTGFDSVGEHLVKDFEKEMQAAEQRSKLKLVKRVSPAYPADALKKLIDGTVIVRIVVDKNGAVSDAKALKGPSELFASSVEAARQSQFEPPQNAPVTTDFEITYGYSPAPCSPGKKGDRANVFESEKFPMKSEHPGALSVVDAAYNPMPPYPASARDAGIEGDLGLFVTISPAGEVVGVRVTKSVDAAIDEAAKAAVRNWKFRVTRGTQWGFPFKFHYQMNCDSVASK